MTEKTQDLAPVVVRPGLAWAARFAALIAIAALCVWVDGATRVLALADSSTTTPWRCRRASCGSLGSG